MPARGLTTLQTIIQGLTGGAPNQRVKGTGKSAPYGVEAILEYNGVYLNVREWADTFLVKTINGLDDADIRDSRAPNPGDDGETPFNSYYGGRTLVISGKVLAGTVDRLRDMNQGVRGAFSEINREYPLVFHGRDPERAIYINCRKNTPLQLPEEQTTPNDFTRLFNITLRASNPRFLSVVKLKNTITSVGAYIDFETITAPTIEDFASVISGGLSSGYTKTGDVHSSGSGFMLPGNGALRNLLFNPNGLRYGGPSSAGWGTYVSAGHAAAMSPLMATFMQQPDPGFYNNGFFAGIRPNTDAPPSVSWYAIYSGTTDAQERAVPGRWYGFRARVKVANYEMIENPTFETDLAGWNTESWAGPVKTRTTNWSYASPGVASLYLVSGALGAAGQNSIEYNVGAHKIAAGPNANRLIVIGGGTYEYRASIKVINRQQTAVGYLQIDWFDVNGNYISSNTSSPQVGPVAITDETKWVGTAPANAVACSPRIVINGGASGGLMEMYVDDVYLHPVGITGSAVTAASAIRMNTRFLDAAGAVSPGFENELAAVSGNSAATPIVATAIPVGGVYDLWGRYQAPAGVAYVGMELVLTTTVGPLHGGLRLGNLQISELSGPDAPVPEYGDSTRPGWMYEGTEGNSASRKVFPVANSIQNPIAAVDTFGVNGPTGGVSRITGQSNNFTGGTTAFRSTATLAGFTPYVDIANNSFGESYTMYADPGRSYVFSFYGKTATPEQTPRQYKISIYWYNAAKKLINWSDTYWYETTTWQRYVAGGAPAPAGTAYVQVRISWLVTGAGAIELGEAHDFGWLMWHEGITPKVFTTAGGVGNNEPRYIPARELHRSETLGPLAQMNYVSDPDVNYVGGSEWWDQSRAYNAVITKIAAGGPVDNGRYALLSYNAGSSPQPYFGFAAEAPYGLAAGQEYWSAGAYMRVPPGNKQMKLVIEADWFDMYGGVVKFDSTPEFEVNDQWTWYNYESLQAPAGAVSVRFYFINLNPALGDQLHVDKLICTDSKTVGEFFDATSDWGETQYQNDNPDGGAARRFFYSMWKTLRTFIAAQQTVKLTTPAINNVVTNYVRNPSFEVDTTDWTPYVSSGGTATITRQGGSVHDGLYGVRMLRTAGAANMGLSSGWGIPVPMAAGRTWTLSAWVRGPAGRTGMCFFDWQRFGVYESTTMRDAQNGRFTFTGGWQRVSVTMAIPMGTIGFTNIYVWLEGAQTGDAFEADSFMVTEGTRLYDYFDGSMLGNAWVGAAHASYSSPVPKFDRIDEVHLVLAWVNTDNQIYAALTKAGKVGVYMRRDGVLSALVESGSAVALAPSTNYWLRGRMAAGTVFVEWYTADPNAASPATALTSLKSTLLTNDSLYFEKTLHPLALGIQSRGMKLKVDEWRYTDMSEPKGWNYYEGAGTLTVKSGKLMPLDMTPKMITRSGLTYKVADGILTAKITRTENPPEGQTWSMGIVGKVIDKNNYLFVRLNHLTIPSGQAGYQYGYQFGAVVGGVENSWVTSEATIPLNSPRWLRMKTVGDVVTLEAWTTDPALGGAAAQSYPMTLGSTMNGSTAQEKTLFGAGKKGEFGVKMWSPNPLTQGIEDFRLEMPTFDDIAFTVKNEGNYAAQSRIELTGPMSNPRITNEANGRSMLINTAIPAGETWVIEQIGSSKLVYRKSDAANRMQYFDDTSDWIVIEPDGVPNNIRLTATGMGIGWDLDLTYQHTWM